MAHLKGNMALTKGNTALHHVRNEILHTYKLAWVRWFSEAWQVQEDFQVQVEVSKHIPRISYNKRYINKIWIICITL